MTKAFDWALRHGATITAALLVAASAALTLGFACAVPFAAFAVISALLFDRAAAIGVILAVWLANQLIGFGIMHYPTDPSTFAWGATLGGIALLSLGAASAVLARLSGVLGTGLGFLAAFAAYEGAVYAACLMSGADVLHFALASVTRLFLINAFSLGGLLAARALWSRSAWGRDVQAAHAIRHA